MLYVHCHKLGAGQHPSLKSKNTLKASLTQIILKFKEQPSHCSRRSPKPAQAAATAARAGRPQLGIFDAIKGAFDNKDYTNSPRESPPDARHRQVSRRSLHALRQSATSPSDFWHDHGPFASVQAEILKQKISEFGADRPMEKLEDGRQEGTAWL